MKTDNRQEVLREEDIRPALLMKDKQHCLEWDINFLLSRKANWIEVNCPACSSIDHHTYGEKNGFKYTECNGCGTVYTNPRPPLEILHSFYSQSKNYDYWNKYIFPQTEEVRKASIFRPRARRVAELAEKLGVERATLIEVGAAYGWFCEEIESYSIFDRVIAVEPTPGLAATCRRKGFETYELPIEKLEMPEVADVIVSFEVIEHLFSPKKFLERCYQLLKPKGLIVISCPNVRGLDVGTLRVKSGTFDHEHLNYFHPDSLSLLMEGCGFKTVGLETPGKLDVDILKKNFIEGEIDLDNQFFLKELLLNGNDIQLQNFQQFISENRYSSHMWVIAQKP